LGLWQYIVKRLIQMIPVLLGVSIVAFLMLHITPGDPVQLMLPDDEIPDEATMEHMREELGLNRPLPVQYFDFLSGAVRGDLGRSIRRDRPVTLLILRDLPYTIELGIVALLMVAVVGITTGVIAGVRAGSLMDTLTMGAAMLGVSMPNFWLGLVLIYWLGVRWAVVPVLGEGTMSQLLLPGFTLGFSGAATIARVTRSTILEVMGSDYIRTARAKGLAERTVTYRHALRNALIPVVTLLGLRIGQMMAGSVVVENVFFRRGIGRLVILSLTGKDFPLVQGIVLLMATAYVLANLLVDVVYSFIDPRISYN